MKPALSQNGRRFCLQNFSDSIWSFYADDLSFFSGYRKTLKLWLSRGFGHVPESKVPEKPELNRKKAIFWRIKYSPEMTENFS